MNNLLFDGIDTILFFIILYLYLSKTKSLSSKILGWITFGISIIILLIAKYHYLHTNTISLIVLLLLSLISYLLPTINWYKDIHKIFFHLSIYLCFYQWSTYLLQCIYFLYELPGQWNLFNSALFSYILLGIRYLILWMICVPKISLIHLPSEHQKYGPLFFIITFSLMSLQTYMNDITSIYILSFISFIHLLIGTLILKYIHYNQVMQEQIHYFKMKHQTPQKQEYHQYQNNLKVKDEFFAKLDWIQNHYQDQPQECLSFLKELQDHIQSSLYIQNDNSVLTSFLNIKIQAMKLQHIHVQLLLETDLQNISAFHLTTILGNILDNAIEAQRYVIKRKISIHIYEEDDFYYIQVSNPYHPKTLKINDCHEFISFKPNKEQHGIGLKNVKDCVQQLQGLTHIETNRNIFSISIMIPKGESLC